MQKLSGILEELVEKQAEQRPTENQSSKETKMKSELESAIKTEDTIKLITTIEKIMGRRLIRVQFRNSV